MSCMQARWWSACATFMCCKLPMLYCMLVMWAFFCKVQVLHTPCRGCMTSMSCVLARYRRNSGHKVTIGEVCLAGQAMNMRWDEHEADGSEVGP